MAQRSAFLSKFNENVFKATNLTVKKRERPLLIRDEDSLRETAPAIRTFSLENDDVQWKISSRQFRENDIEVDLA